MATTLTAENKEYIPARWEETDCPFCHGAEARTFEKFGYKHRYRFVRCRGCGLAYQNPRPAFDSDFKETAYQVYSTSDQFFDSSELTPQGVIVQKEYGYILKEIESWIGRKGRLLEIGCNTGYFCKVAKDEGWQPTGIELSATMAEHANRTYGIETRAGDWTQMKFEGPFDAIYCSHVIEHIPNPEEWLLKFRGILKPGGIICLSVPNVQSVDRKYKRLLKRLGLRKDRWEKWRTPDHLYEPCEKSMLRFMRASQYDVLKTYSYPSEWTGQANLWHKIFHFKLRMGAKARFLIRPANLDV
jgi:SAM-dependent methyltransferase